MFEEPAPDCALCPRLVAFRQENRAAFPGFHNAPVPAFGSLQARLLVVGLAPGLKGANQTGRPDDGLRLVDCRVTNAVRCVPPENKPTGAEARNCRPFLLREIGAMPQLRVILCLGGLSHGAVLTTLGVRKSLYPFRHGAFHDVDGLTVADSYHCSRYNTNTGRLTEAMFEEDFVGLRDRLAALPQKT